MSSALMSSRRASKSRSEILGTTVVDMVGLTIVEADKTFEWAMLVRVEGEGESVGVELIIYTGCLIVWTDCDRAHGRSETVDGPRWP